MAMSIFETQPENAAEVEKKRLSKKLNEAVKYWKRRYKEHSKAAKAFSDAAPAGRRHHRKQMKSIIYHIKMLKAAV